MTTKAERIQQLDAAWNALTDDLSAAIATAQLVRNKALNVMRDRASMDDDKVDRVKRIEATTSTVERMLKTIKEVHHDY